MEPKPIYKIRKNGKQEVFEGTLEEVRKWLRQNNISSSQEMRRQGFSVLEHDEFWGLVSDFPEFSMTERQGRAFMVGKVKSAQRLLALAVLMAIGSLGFFVYTQILPAFAETLERDKYQARIDKLVRDAELLEKARLKDIQDIETRHAQREAELREENGAVKQKVAELSREIVGIRSKLVASVNEANSSKQSLREKTDEVFRLNGALTEARDRIKVLNNNNDRLQSEVRSVGRKIPIIVTWENAIIGRGKVLNLRNPTVDDLEVRLLIYSANGDTKRRDVVIESGKTLSTRWVSVDHDFVPGESLVISHATRPGDFDEITYSVPE